MLATAITLPPCPGPLGPVCAAAGGAGSVAIGAGAGAVLSAMAGWVVTGAGWLLGQMGAVMSATTRVDVTAGWFTSHYAVMAEIGMVVALPLLLAGVVQAVYHQSAASLARAAFVQLPLAALLTGAAVQLVQWALAATDALCTAVSAGTGGGVDHALAGLANALVVQAAGGPYSAPLFVVLIGALLVASGALALWVELLVRAAAVYVAVLFLPLALASLVWPAVSHWCRRLVDTLAALVLSKFVIVAILSLAVGALGSGTSTGFSAVLSGGALLLLAAFAPFLLLRLVPAIEAGAVHQLEGARQRVRQAAGPLPESAAAHALRGIREGRLPTLDPGPPGAVGGEGPVPATTGVSRIGRGGTPGGDTLAGQDLGGGESAGGGPGAAIPELPGQPASDVAFWEVLGSPRPPVMPMRGTGGALPGSTILPLWSTADRPGGAGGTGMAGGAAGGRHGGGGDGLESASGRGGTDPDVGWDDLGPIARWGNLGESSGDAGAGPPERDDGDHR